MSFSLNKLVQPECGGSNPLVSVAQQIALKPANVATFQSNQQQASAIGGTHHMAKSSGSTTNFVKDFMQQNLASDPNLLLRQTPNIGQNSSITSLKQQPSSAVLKQPHWFEQQHKQWAQLNQIMTQPLNHISQQQEPTTSAAEQLEIKYRNDIIAQTTSLQNNQTKETHKDDLNLKHSSDKDDLEFWQALSQKYTGFKTTDDAQLTAESNTENDVEVTGDNLADLFIGDGAYEEPEAIIPERISSDFDEYHFDERNPLKNQFEDPFAEGLKKLEQGDIPSAALLFEAAVINDPNNVTAWRYLGTTQAQNEKDMSAIRALRNCLKLNPNDQEARLAIAASLANETYHYEACKHLIDWLINHDKYKSAGASLGEFHQFDAELSNDPFYINAVHEKHYKYVRDKFVEAARMSPNNPDPEVQNALGVLFNMRGEYDKAVDCFKAAISVRLNDSLLWNRLGATLANGNKSEEAVIAYRKALDISPGFLRSRYNLAISLIHLNTYDEAAKQLVQILNMQAAGKGSKNSQIRTRSITSSGIWNTLRTVLTLLNRYDLYPIVDGRDLAACNRELLGPTNGSTSSGN